MALRSDWSQELCPAARGINVLADPWVLLLLRELFSGLHRFEAFRVRLGVADNVLSKRLAAMVDAGLITKTAYETGSRPRFDYRLTEAGADALTVLHSFALWGEKHAPRAADSPRLQIFCRQCQAESRTGESCSACGAALTSQTTSWLRPGVPRTAPMALAGPESSPPFPPVAS